MCWDDAEYIHKTTNHSVSVGHVTIQLFSTFFQLITVTTFPRTQIHIIPVIEILA